MYVDWLSWLKLPLLLSIHSFVSVDNPMIVECATSASLCMTCNFYLLGLHFRLITKQKRSSSFVVLFRPFLFPLSLFLLFDLTFFRIRLHVFLWKTKGLLRPQLRGCLLILTIFFCVEDNEMCYIWHIPTTYCVLAIINARGFLSFFWISSNLFLFSSLFSVHLLLFIHFFPCCTGKLTSWRQKKKFRDLIQPYLKSLCRICVFPPSPTPFIQTYILYKYGERERDWRETLLEHHILLGSG